jgi:hypothetical protein
MDCYLNIQKLVVVSKIVDRQLFLLCKMTGRYMFTAL